MVAQIAAREKRFQHAHGQRRHNPHARIFQAAFPFAAEERAAAHRIRQNGAFHTAFCRIAHRRQQGLNPALRLYYVKRQCTGLAGSLNIRQHRIHNFIGLRQQAHGVVVTRRQTSYAGRNVGNALIAAAHLVARIQILVMEMPLGKLAVKHIHLFHPLGARHAQTRFSHQKIRPHTKQRKHKQDNQPGKRRPRIALAVQHAHHTHRHRSNVQKQKHLSPRNSKHSRSVKQSGLRYHLPDILYG